MSYLVDTNVLSELRRKQPAPLLPGLSSRSRYDRPVPGMPTVPVAFPSLMLNDAPRSPTLQDVKLSLAMACGNRRVPVLLFSPAD